MWLVSVCVHLNVHKCGLHPLFPLFFSCREKQKKEAERKTVLVVSSPWIMLSLIFADYMCNRWPSPSESESVSCSVVSDSLQTHGLYSPPVSSIHGISRQECWSGLPFTHSSLLRCSGWNCGGRLTTHSLGRDQMTPLKRRNFCLRTCEIMSFLCTF